MTKSIQRYISIRGARHHNLKSVDIDIPHDQLVVITGPSGSGKSSLAFDTLYAEGQRRYIESLSSYARQFITQHAKPEMDSISGLSPAISIDQKTTSKNPRSTVATITELQDYLRILFARVGTAYSPATGLPLKRQSPSSIVKALMSLPEETKIRICAPFVRNKKGSHQTELAELQKRGYERVKINGKTADLASLPILDKSKIYTIEVVVDRIIVNETSRQRIVDSVESAMKIADGTMCVDIVELPDGKSEFTLNDGRVVSTKETNLFSEKLACPVSDFAMDSIEPKIFSFNSPYGACTVCNGLGYEISFKKSLIVPDERKTLREGAIEPWQMRSQRYYTQVLETVAKHYGFLMDVPFCELSKDHQEILFKGSGEEMIEFVISDGYSTEKIKRKFTGVISELEKMENDMDDLDIDIGISRYRDQITCRSCNGYRLKPESLCIKIAGKHIGELTSMSIDETIDWFKNLNQFLTESENIIAKPLLKEICARLSFLIDVGLNYLTLARESSSLSGGEAQRIRLASQLGSGLCGVIYVLDEPSIGLHQSDNQKLIKTLKRLRDSGNSVIVVEHDVETMMAADYIVDIGPGAGIHGGEVVAQGTIEEIIKDPNSITGAFLSGRNEISVPKIRRKYGKRQYIEIVNASQHNLKNLTMKIPLGLFVAVSGVSGGGKSTLIIETLYKALAMKINGASDRPGKHDEIRNIDHIEKIIKIDQSPIGRTPRSNPATYTGMFSLIRDWFTALPESRARGYKSSRFSFNVKGGRCENCKGDGIIKIGMHFLPDVYIECDVCKGKRYNSETLEVKHKDKSISDVLDMNVSEASEFFRNLPTIREKLIALEQVGLGYIKIGQPATTLSGGEAQRIKLAKELSRKSTGDTLYILDEPTTGLHTVDIKKLLNVLHALVDNGNTVLVIEHNIDVIKTADYMFDIGPKGGKSGGYIVAHGTPEEVAENPDSVTGPFIKAELNKKVKNSDKQSEEVASKP